MRTCNAVKIHAPKLMKVDGRQWSVPSVAFFTGRKNGEVQASQKDYEALKMSRELAEKLVGKLTLAGLQAEVCDVYCDDDTAVMETMSDIGEDARPPALPPTSLQELSKAIENCFHRDGLSPLEVLNFCCRVVEATIMLECMWDEIAQHYEVDVLCGYFRSAFANEESISTLERVCAEHTAAHGRELCY